MPWRRATGRQNAFHSRFLRGNLSPTLSFAPPLLSPLVSISVALSISISLSLSLSLSPLFLSTEMLQVFVYIGPSERASACVELASALLAIGILECSRKDGRKGTDADAGDGCGASGRAAHANLRRKERTNCDRLHLGTGSSLNNVHNTWRFLPLS